MNKEDLADLIANRLGEAFGEASGIVYDGPDSCTDTDRVEFEGIFNIKEFAWNMAKEIIGE